MDKCKLYYRIYRDRMITGHLDRLSGIVIASTVAAKLVPMCIWVPVLAEFRLVYS